LDASVPLDAGERDIALEGAAGFNQSMGGNIAVGTGSCANCAGSVARDEAGEVHFSCRVELPYHAPLPRHERNQVGRRVLHVSLCHPAIVRSAELVSRIVSSLHKYPARQQAVK
jgi:hypothetical protein